MLALALDTTEKYDKETAPVNEDNVHESSINIDAYNRKFISVSIIFAESDSLI